MSSSTLGLFGKLFGARAAGGASRATVASSKPEAEHGPIDEWFTRTARILLGGRRSGLGSGKPQLSPLQQRIATLEKENAVLSADNHRLADEVIALRTMLYVGRKPKPK